MREISSLIQEGNINFIGEWEIDYSTLRFRASGQIGPLFGISRDRLSEYIPLSSMNRYYSPSDLDHIRRNRYDNSDLNSVRSMHLELHSPVCEGTIDAYCFKRMNRDRFGVLKQARGVLFAASPVGRVDGKVSAVPTHDDALRHLVGAAKAVGDLGFAHLRSVLQVVFKEVAQDAMRKHLPRH